MNASPDVAAADESTDSDSPARATRLSAIAGLLRRNWFVLLVLILVAVPFGSRWFRLSHVPNVPAPIDVEQMNWSPIPAEDNAFTHFRRAYQQYEAIDADERKQFATAESSLIAGLSNVTHWNDVPEELQAFVQAHPEISETFRQGSRCDQSRYIEPENFRVTTLLPVTQFLRTGSLLCCLDALRLMDEGDRQSAAEYLHDAYRASRHSGRQGFMIERAVGAHLHANAVAVWRTWSRQADTAEELETALERIRRDWQLTAKPSENLHVQYLSVVNDLQPSKSYLRELLTESVNKQWVAVAGNRSGLIATQLNSYVPGWTIPVLFWQAEPELTRRGAKLWLTHELKTCDLPLAEQLNRAPGFFAFSQTPDLTCGLTAAQLEDVLKVTYLNELMFSPGWFHTALARETCVQALLETELMLQIEYRRRQITTREAAESLLPEFAWPIDPSSPTSVLIGHRLTDDGVMLTCGSESVVIPWPTDTVSVREE